ncbi:MAG: IclR family transcriptional regulator [Firmicutes bacterium]|nr:IclR family transcriptional regulator [Bacillota bacterium]
MVKNANASSIKALKLLNLFTPSIPSLTLDDISTMSGLSKSTAFRMLSALVSSGLIDVSGDSRGPRRYRLGLRLLELGQMVAEQMEIRSIALPFMVKLRDEIEEAVQLVVMDREEAVYIEKVETTQPVRLYTRVGRKAPVYAGACPRALVAFLPDDELQRILDEQILQRFTPVTITDRKELEERIRMERAQGYTISCGELYEGTWAIAMPIRDYTGKVVASISIAGPQARFGPEREPVLVKALKSCVDAVSSKLGYRPSAGEEERG